MWKRVKEKEKKGGGRRWGRRKRENQRGNKTRSLAGQRFTSREDKPYCAECFGELFSKRCAACSKPITGKNWKNIRLEERSGEVSSKCYTPSSDIIVDSFTTWHFANCSLMYLWTKRDVWACITPLPIFGSFCLLQLISSLPPPLQCVYVFACLSRITFPGQA